MYTISYLKSILTDTYHSIKSLADADAVVQIKRPWSKGHFRKGKALMALDRHEEARDAILLGLEFEPSNEVG